MYPGEGARGEIEGMDGRRDLISVMEQCIRIRGQVATRDDLWHMCHLSTLPKMPSLAGRVSIREARGRRDLALTALPLSLAPFTP